MQSNRIEYRGDCERVSHLRRVIHCISATMSPATSGHRWLDHWMAQSSWSYSRTRIVRIRTRGDDLGSSCYIYGWELHRDPKYDSWTVHWSDCIHRTSGRFTNSDYIILLQQAHQNCLATRQLSQLTKGFVFINLGTTALIIVILLAMTPKSEMHPASYVFGSAGLVNQSKGWNSGLAFVFGLLSVQWTVHLPLL